VLDVLGGGGGGGSIACEVFTKKLVISTGKLLKYLSSNTWIIWIRVQNLQQQKILNLDPDSGSATMPPN
jgi:hypothetical protein